MLRRDHRPAQQTHPQGLPRPLQHTNQGLTPEGFEARVRSDLSTRQVEVGVTGTGFATPPVADVALNAFLEKREVQIARFLAADYATKVNPMEAELEAFYKENPNLFQAPEAATIEYVVLDLESVKKSISVSEQDVKTYYDQNAARLSGSEERQASHHASWSFFPRYRRQKEGCQATKRASRRGGRAAGC